MNSQGTGGGPSSHPDEGCPDTDTDVLVDDGSGVDRVESAPSAPPDGGTPSEPAPDGGGGQCSSENPADMCEEPEEPVCRDAADGGAVADDARRRLAAAAGGAGAPLPERLRRRLEREAGDDLGDVRVHTDGAAAEAARALRANAFATGRDIHFAAGKYDPDSAAGQRLIAHEVAHTVQQGPSGRAVQGKLEVSAPGDRHEVEADRFADAFVAGDPRWVGLGRIGRGSLSGEVVARDPEGGAAAPAADGPAAPADGAQAQNGGAKKKPKVTVQISGPTAGPPISFSAANYRELYRQVSERADGGEPAGTHSIELKDEATQTDLDTGDVVTVDYKLALATAIPAWPAKSSQPQPDQQKFDSWRASVDQHEKAHEAAYRREYEKLKTEVVGPKESDVQGQYAKVESAAEKAQDVVDQNQPAPLAAPGGTEKVGQSASAEGGEGEGAAADDGATEGGAAEGGTAEGGDVQYSGAGSAGPDAIPTAMAGVSGAATSLRERDRVQRLFGGHDLTGVC